jgi:sulfite reductase (NADPH) flavoprotein alpha-component
LQLQETNSPFKQDQVELLNRLLPTLTPVQRIWLSGYLSAAANLGANGDAVQTGTIAAQAPSSSQAANGASREVTILFGSQTGNSEKLAKKLKSKLEQQQFEVSLSSMRDFKPNGLKKVQNLLIIVSTHGEGEPPDNAMSFYEFLHSKRAPKLDGMQYSVLALGDTSYEFFCQTGKDFDKRLEELGATRIVPRADCDLDFEEPANEWMNQVLSSLSERLSVNSAGATVAASASSEEPEPSIYSRTNPFYAEVIENINLNGRGSDLETRHLVLSLEGSNLRYEPGDCIGIYPENDPEIVDALISRMNWNPDEPVVVSKDGATKPLREALLRSFEITILSRKMIEQLANFTSDQRLHELLAQERAAELKEYLKGRDLIDLVTDFSPWNATAQQFISQLRKLPPRLYSIASSYKANPDEVTLVIRAVRYEAHGRERKGVCSVYCAERLQPGDKVPIFVQENSHFKLPANPETPIIMVGPGTGVAPFRSFIEEREETGVAGKAWLFYGDRRFRTDFLYQTDWQRWLKSGALTRMDVAFSRDTDQKVYVQHRMLERSREIYEWLEEGAYFYVCGDKSHMAKDVHETLLQIIEREGNKTRSEAEAYLDNMKAAGRYQRDVY